MDKPWLLGDDSCHWHPPFFSWFRLRRRARTGDGMSICLEDEAQRPRWFFPPKTLDFEHGESAGWWVFFAWHEFLVIFLGWFHHEEMIFIFFAMIWSFFEIRGMEGGNFQLGSSGSTRSKNTLNPNLLRLLLLNHGRTLPTQESILWEQGTRIFISFYWLAGFPQIVTIHHILDRSGQCNPSTLW